MVRLTDRPDMTFDVYRGRKTTMQQQQQYMFDFGLYTQVSDSGPHDPLVILMSIKNSMGS